MVGAAEIGQRLPADPRAFTLLHPPPQPPAWILASLRGDGASEPIVRFPMADLAVHTLASKRILLPEQFRRQDERARQTAFTIATVQSESALEKFRNYLAEDVRRGGTLREFEREVERVAGKSALASHHIENVYRTQVLSSYGGAQRQILDLPLVSSALPYVVYSATHDARVRPEHLAMERLGIQGTAVYRADDPVIRRFWPPWSWSCRCDAIAITLRDAAERYGIHEAQEWLRTGRPPENPTYVQMPSFSPPPGFGWLGAA